MWTIYLVFSFLLFFAILCAEEEWKVSAAKEIQTIVYILKWTESSRREKITEAKRKCSVITLSIFLFFYSFFCHNDDNGVTKHDQSVIHDIEREKEKIFSRKNFGLERFLSVFFHLVDGDSCVCAHSLHLQIKRKPQQQQWQENIAINFETKFSNYSIFIFALSVCSWRV